MRNKLLICFLLIASSSFCAEIGNSPLLELDALIDSTEGLVTKQKELKTTLEKYLKLHDEYLKDLNNKELLLKTAKLANQALETIKTEKMSNLFPPAFISEMTLFAKLASKPSLPKIE